MFSMYIKTQPALRHGGREHKAGSVSGIC